MHLDTEVTQQYIVPRVKIYTELVSREERSFTSTLGPWSVLYCYAWYGTRRKPTVLFFRLRFCVFFGCVMFPGNVHISSFALPLPFFDLSLSSPPFLAPSHLSSSTPTTPRRVCQASRGHIIRTHTPRQGEDTRTSEEEENKINNGGD